MRKRPVSIDANDELAFFKWGNKTCLPLLSLGIPAPCNTRRKFTLGLAIKQNTNRPAFCCSIPDFKTVIAIRRYVQIIFNKVRQLPSINQYANSLAISCNIFKHIAPSKRFCLNQQGAFYLITSLHPGLAQPILGIVFFLCGLKVGICIKPSLGDNLCKGFVFRLLYFLLYFFGQFFVLFFLRHFHRAGQRPFLPFRYNRISLHRSGRLHDSCK